MNTVRGVEEHVRMALRILNSLLWESLFHEWVWQLIFWNVAFSDYQSSYISGWGPAHTLLKNAENKSCIIFIMIFHFLTFIWNKAIVVLWVAAFFDQNINLLALQLLTYFIKKMRKAWFSNWRNIWESSNIVLISICSSQGESHRKCKFDILFGETDPSSRFFLSKLQICKC